MPSSSKDCSGCLQDVAKQARQLCPNHTDARIRHDCCFSRYNSKEFHWKSLHRTALTGFATVTYGKGIDKVYGLGQCRGDVSSKDCFSCIQDAAKPIQEVCLDQADAMIWFDYCFLRYGNINFLGKVDTDFSMVYFNDEEAA
ncbi:hypothetical protein SADUNF_Sadunf02G0197800 [Salix dunnii]|uniref:Gnk2-homologous domain-containing protein n=1 Tax=Salix dunnii TaxID=1413687 RepID=A0A835N993_9ROSI|nr:hypothetical protein SADUNF_Sadunf02G0197800 [Salix dunnii]